MKRMKSIRYYQTCIYCIILCVCPLAACDSDAANEPPKEWPSDSWSVYYEGRLWGFRDAEGKVVLPAQYDDITDFWEGRAFIKSQESWVLIDESGTRISDKHFAGADPGHFINGISAVKVETDTGIRSAYIDRDGRYIVEPIYKGSISQFEGKYGQISGPDGTWFFDRQGNLVAEFLGMKYFSEGLAAVQPQDSDGMWGYIDEDLKLVVEAKFKDTDGFSEGFAAVVPLDSDGLWGYIDRQFKVVIAPKYEAVDIFSEGLAPVVLDGKVGYINKQGETVIPCRFMRGSNFVSDRAAVDIGTGWIWIDRQGTQLSAPKPEDEMFLGYSCYFGDYFASISAGPAYWSRE
jgi:WG containing repeat